MRQAYNYSIIQFLPYLETGEFANIGVLVFSPRHYFLDFKLAPTHLKRVNNFFDKLDKTVYKEAINLFIEEFQLIQTITQNLAQDEFLHYMQNMLVPKESIVRFSEIKTIMVDDNTAVVEQLYNHYIGRDFIHRRKQNREQMITAQLRHELKALKDIGIVYKKQDIKTNLRTVKNLPFVAEINKNLRVIKPLSFQQQQATDVIEHGEHWLNRFDWLIKNKKINPENILLPVESPEKDKDLHIVFNAVMDDIQEKKIHVIDFSKRKEVMHFAQYGCL